MKTVLVTGGNRGIGLEICRQLDELGYTVLMGSRSLEKGLKAARLLSKNVIVKQLDVTQEEDIQNLYKFVNSQYGKLDVLINNAGLGTQHAGHQKPAASKLKSIMETKFTTVWMMVKKYKPILKKVGISNQRYGVADISLQNVKQLMETNFYGAWRMSQVFIPLLLKSENGQVINMSSGLGELSNLTGEYPAYSLSKSSLNALTIMLSNELKEKEIKVNAMCPGWVRTDMGGPDAPRSVSEGADTAVWLTTEKKIPTGNFFRDRKEINW